MMNRLEANILVGYACQRIRRHLRRFANGERGTAAVEFALMVPAMLFVWVGMVVASDAMIADKKVTLLARTLADMTTQMQAVSQADLDSVFQATESVMWPQPAKSIGMRVTSIDVDANGVAFIDWSGVPTNTLLKGSYTALARCSAFPTLPEGLKVPRTSIVLAEVSLTYTASVPTQIVDELFDGMITGGQIPLGDHLYMRARQSAKVSFNPPPGGNCPGYVP
jgi:Flp pilus assembly protein TadG